MAPPTDSQGNFDPALNGYYSLDIGVDRAAYELEEMVMFYAAGNEAAGSTISHPANAKHSVAVAANAHGNSPFIQGFSSRGPANDGRYKPDLSAPGAQIQSAAGDDNNSSTDTPTTSAKTGTSMATPTAAGAAALMRQYYVDGFYPTGVRNLDDQSVPTGALMKATLLNGTNTNSNTPGIDSGWGRVWLDHNLYFAGDRRQSRIWDLPNRSGLRSAEQREYTIRVQGGEEFRATLVWFDPPGSPSAAIALVNDLNLEVETPNGTVFAGNNFFGGVSNSGGDPDRLNPVEQVLIANPTGGLYKIRVSAASVPGDGSQGSDRQGFALVASSRQCDTGVIDGPSLTLSTDAQGVSLSIESVSGARDYQVYASEGSCSSASAQRYRFVGTANNTSFLDDSALGGAQYAYRVRAVDVCGEGPMGACQSIVSAASCKLFPSFDQSSVTASRLDSSTCGVDLSWANASPNCAGARVSYNLYRSTDESFLPGSDNLLVKGLSSSAYTDLAVDSLITYYYVVRAEDNTPGGLGPNNGNESPGQNRVGITTFANTSSPATYVDDPDTGSLSTRDPEWRVTSAFSSTGTMSFHNAEDGQNYAALTCARIVSPVIGLQAGASSTLSYDARFNLEVDWDGVIVEVSNDGGQSWQDLPPAGGYPGDLNMTLVDGEPINQCGYPPTQGAFNGLQNSFRTYTSDLSAFAGQEIMVRFSFTSDPGAEFEGFYLDNIQITGASTPDMCMMADLSGVTAAASGPWLSPGQDGHGWLLEFLEGPAGKTSERINAYWYVYQDGAPVWLAGGGPIDGNSATLDMFITSGPSFPPDFESEDLVADPWGTLTFDFDSDVSGTASWSSSVGDFGSGSLPMEQLAALSDSPASCQSGSYYNQDQSGHGFVAQVVSLGGVDNLLLAWYVYLDGQQVWMLGIAPLVDGIADVPLSIYSGGDFPPNFDPASVLETPWGTVSFEFTGPNAASASWSSDFEGFGDGSIQLERLTTLEDHVCN